MADRRRRRMDICCGLVSAMPSAAAQAGCGGCSTKPVREPVERPRRPWDLRMFVYALLHLGIE